MIDRTVLENYAKKNGVLEVNVVREYLQNLFLKNFYDKQGSENFLFKGGTALKIVFSSPRFSEDLDFSGVSNGKYYEKILLETLRNISNEGIKVDLLESKSTSGGWLSILEFRLWNYRIQMLNEVSLRKRKMKGETILVSSEFFPAFGVYLLSVEELVKEKVLAFLSRKKPRDLFDVYFILRDGRLRKYFPFERSEEVVKVVDEIDDKEVSGLKIFLPKSYHLILKGLKNKVKAELTRF